MSLVRSSEQEPGTPERLGDDIEDGKEEDLCIGVELPGSLAKSESDGVSGPDDDKGERDLVVETSDLGAAEESGGATRGDELEQDPGEGDAREGEETPLASLGRVNAGNDTGNDHDLIGEDEDDNLGDGETSEEGQVEEEEGSGQLTSSKVKFARSRVTFANVGQSLADAGSHGKVRESSDSSDEEGGGVHETVSVRSALGRDEEEDGEAGHDEEDGPKVGVTPLSRDDGVLEVRRNGRDADIGLLESVKDAVVVERVHCVEEELARQGPDGCVLKDALAEGVGSRDVDSF
ncbi:hypothetical protein PHSY_003098 [Pseudozyma hubeiensis SY62]|uniref:Uncharacterized protein n=1 Tax=Pseudozyma hubeiensis (strain SY62) TaxID=1305764 RepID=R9P2R1_PSEHS|nr:hypothetical protein PHSY_003098 [Pseudozyma hubeiensis SY62]GAC95522.1 hypothetical protein PHSY_003098 [Pseudozyma hubeiensis SY62]